MGRQKDAEIAVDDAWDRIAQEKGYVCARCGNVIPKSELDTSKQPLMCGWCSHQMNKDD